MLSSVSHASHFLTTGQQMSLAISRYRPWQLDTSQAPRGQHGGVGRALGDDLMAFGSKDRKHMSSSLGVDGERLRVRVIDCVAGLVIARILLDASTGVEATDRLADVHERLVVTATSEASRSDIDALLGEVFYK